MFSPFLETLLGQGPLHPVMIGLALLGLVVAVGIWVMEFAGWTISRRGEDHPVHVSEGADSTWGWGNDARACHRSRNGYAQDGALNACGSSSYGFPGS